MDATRLLAALTLIFVSLSVGGRAAAQSESRFDQAFPQNDSRYANNRFGNPSRPPQFDSRPGGTQPQQFPSNSQQQVPTQFHGEPNFLIPFQRITNVDSIGEVQLYVSTQQGRDWRLHSKQLPTAEGFPFQSAGDGEYWFAVRTTDRTGRLNAAEPTQPEMKVVVDTKQPRIDLRVTSDPSGKVIAEWLAEDAHLQSHTFRLLYRDPRGDWRQVAIRTPHEDDNRKQWQGTTRWSLPRGMEQVELVAEVKDEANNTRRVRKQVSLGRGPSFASDTQPRHFANRSSDGLAANGRLGGSQVSSRVQANGTPANRSQAAGTPAASSQQSRPIGGTLSDVANGMSRWFRGVQHVDASSHGARPQVNRVSSSGGVNQRRQPLTQRPQQPIGQRRTGFDDRQQRGVKDSANSWNHFNSKPWGNRRPHITASPNFEVDYELRGVDQRGARRVELWVTRDGGQTWHLHGADHDKQSPMEVRLTREGIYGFRITVQGFDSQAPQPPQGNEPADLWVAADWTKPAGRITRAKLNESRDGRELVIDWIAEDALLEDQPISLQYSTSTDGPWYPIATAIQNSGTYRWRLDGAPPRTLLLRMQVRDIAGNVTTTNVFDATASQYGTPEASIIGIREPRSAWVPVTPANRFQ